MSKHQFFTEEDKVIQLTNKQKFNDEVLNSGKIWYICIWVDWSGYSTQFIPTWKKIANENEYENVNFGTIDLDVDRSIASTYLVNDFPGILYFEGNDNGKTYTEEREFLPIKEHVKETYEKIRMEKINSGEILGGPEDVAVLKDSTFDDAVINSDTKWIISFYQSWSLDWKNFEPEFIYG